MKKRLKMTLGFLKSTKCNSLLGILIGIVVGLIFYSIFNNLVISIILGIVVGFPIMIIIQLKNLDRYADEYEERYGRKRKIEPEDLRGFSKNVDDILNLDAEINEFFEKYSSGKKHDYFEKELNKQWAKRGTEFTNRITKILSNMNNQELLYTLLGTEMISRIVDVFQFFEPYKINPQYLIEHPEKAREYYLDNILQQNAIRDTAINEYFYYRIMDLNYFDDIERFCLSHMSNEELVELAESSKEWQDKLYFYGFLDKEKEVK